MPSLKRGSSNVRANQQGFSLVELMVGIAVGLFIVAGASMLIASQLSDSRRLLMETQLQQDLRATADIITRELRRSGAENDGSAPGFVGAEGRSVSATQRTTISLSSNLSEVGFLYVRGTPAGPWGFRLENGVIRTRLANGGWQDLTDRNTAEITQFRIEPVTVAEEVLPCPRACSADPNDTTCWPKLTQRAYEITITARAVFDPNVQRTIRSRVRLRNDLVEFNPAVPAGGACP